MKKSLRTPLLTSAVLLGLTMSALPVLAQPAADTQINESQIRVERCTADGHCEAARSSKISRDKRAGWKKGSHRLDKLGEHLQLTAAQQPAWEAFRAALREQMQNMRPPAAEGKKECPATALERMQAHEAQMQRHLASMQAQRKAAETFYGQLSAEQKAVFDKEFFRAPHHRPDGHKPHEGKRGNKKFLHKSQ